MAKPNCTGFQTLAPGVYSCSANHMHPVPEELCLANGYAATPENIRMLTETMREIAAADGIPVAEEE